MYFIIVKRLVVKNNIFFHPLTRKVFEYVEILGNINCYFYFYYTIFFANQEKKS